MYLTQPPHVFSIHTKQRGYTLHLTLDTVLADCSKFANDSTCFASMANSSPRNTFHYKTEVKRQKPIA